MGEAALLPALRDCGTNFRERRTAQRSGPCAVLGHYAKVVETPDVTPVAVGHSFGGQISEELLANNLVAAAVSIDPAGERASKRCRSHS